MNNLASVAHCIKVSRWSTLISPAVLDSFNERWIGHQVQGLAVIPFIECRVTLSKFTTSPGIYLTLWAEKVMRSFIF